MVDMLADRLKHQISNKVNNRSETDPALTTTFGWLLKHRTYRNNVYLPFTPAGKDGNIYIVN
jgi:hypothetical protein